MNENDCIMMKDITTKQKQWNKKSKKVKNKSLFIESD